MERYEINKILEKYKVSLISLKDKINIPKLTISLNELSSLMESPDFWSNSIKAKQVSKDYSNLRSIVTEIEELEKNYQNIVDWYSLVEEKTSEWDTLEEDINNFSVSLENFEIKVLLDKEYDNLDAFLELHPGAGGVESMDFAQMLFRMYSRYAKKNNFSVEIIDFTAGDIAGYKSITFKIKGDYAYGNLKSERGVHRLIRLSPFNSGNSRETSFCSCDVYPSVDDNIKIDIKDEDIRIDVFHSSGAGGQSVNTTDSAVRITHIPSGIVVTNQNERSQIKNKEVALSVLKSKLYQLELLKKEKEIENIKGKQLDIDFGSQIRSYFLQPYQLVKDHRSGYEDNDAYSILDGNLEHFIRSYLIMKSD